jgi:hypothetical protein
VGLGREFEDVSVGYFEASSLDDWFVCGREGGEGLSLLGWLWGGLRLFCAGCGSLQHFEGLGLDDVEELETLSLLLYL